MFLLVDLFMGCENPMRFLASNCMVDADVLYSNQSWDPEP